MSDDEGYTGPAVLTVDGRDVPVTVRLDARHEPQDGRRAAARIGDRDPWGRYRVRGVGRPPCTPADPPPLDD